MPVVSFNRKGPYWPIIPAWSATVGQIESTPGAEIKAMCSTCTRSWPLNAAHIAKAKGPFYSLWGRKVRCRCGADAAVFGRHNPGAHFRILGTEEGLENSDVKRLHGRCGWCGGPKD